MKQAMSFAALAAGTAIACLSMLSTLANAQADPKLEWATKVVALQQGPELERLVDQLADSTTQELLQNWSPKLEATVPADKQQRVKEQLNVELKKYFDDVSAAIGAKVNKVSSEALVPAYMEKFTLEELKQVAAFFESPAIKKYQAVTPELGNAFLAKLVDATRAEVVARGKQFDDVAAKILGSTDAKPAPAAKGKAPVKK